MTFKDVNKKNSHLLNKKLAALAHEYSYKAVGDENYYYHGENENYCSYMHKVGDLENHNLRVIHKTSRVN